MRVVIQRVAEASVKVDGEIIGAIQKGLLVLLGVAPGDTEEDARILAEKIFKMRIFEDDAGKMNLSLSDVGGRILLISNFTLLADCRRGNRPDFFRAEKPERANTLYEHFAAVLNELCHEPIEKGRFGADMKVSLINDGPITIVLESDALRAPRHHE